MDYLGIFENDWQKNDCYNEAFDAMGAASANLRQRMSVAFAELRRANREWSKCLAVLDAELDAQAAAREAMWQPSPARTDLWN